MSEATELQHPCQTILDDLRIEWFRYPVELNRGTRRRAVVKPGFPDLSWDMIGTIHNVGYGVTRTRGMVRAIKCEMKLPGKTLDPDQRVRLAAMRRNGSEVYRCESVEFFWEILAGTAQQLTTAELAPKGDG